METTLPSGDPGHPRRLDYGQLIEIVREAALTGNRFVVGLAGEPGSGKTTASQKLVEDLGPLAVAVGMDGFHLRQARLVELGKADRKGAPDTFDAAGYVELLKRIAAQRPGDPEIWAPEFDRALDDAIASSTQVTGEVPIVVTEGNYLLLDGAWAGVRASLSLSVYVEIPRELRMERLIARHRQFGRLGDEAVRWAEGPDEENARLIAATRHRADLILCTE